MPDGTASRRRSPTRTTLALSARQATRHAAEVLKGPDVAPDEGLQVRPGHEFHVQVPGVAQGHHEAVDVLDGAHSVPVLADPEVYLGQVTGWGLVPHDGRWFFRRPQAPHVVLASMLLPPV